MPLTADQTRRLERLKNRDTLYEVVATNGERTVLIVYCGKSQTRFWRALAENDQARAKALVALTGSERIDAGNWKAGIIGTANGWTVKFSGRTQRDAIIEGSHPYLLD